jgi:hypothetical protein
MLFDANHGNEQSCKRRRKKYTSGKQTQEAMYRVKTTNIQQGLVGVAHIAVVP